MIKIDFCIVIHNKHIETNYVETEGYDSLLYGSKSYLETISSLFIKGCIFKSVKGNSMKVFIFLLLLNLFKCIINTFGI